MTGRRQLLNTTINFETQTTVGASRYAMSSSLWFKRRGGLQHEDHPSATDRPPSTGSNAPVMKLA
jgi:hypothetical protein